MRETNKLSSIQRFTKEEIELSHNQMFQLVAALVNKDLDTRKTVLHENLLTLTPNLNGRQWSILRPIYYGNSNRNGDR